MFDPYEAIEGYYQSVLLDHLLRYGVIESLAGPADVGVIARDLGWDPTVLAYILEFLVATTGVIRRDKQGRYMSVLSRASVRGLEFQFYKFIGAYGKTAIHLPAILNGTRKGRDLVDRSCLAAAFSRMAGVATPLIPAFLKAANVKCLLDLACGTGSLLVEMAQSDPDFRGIGVDRSRNMCVAARRHARTEGVAKRVRIVQADAQKGSLPRSFADECGSRLRQALVKTDRKVDGLHARSLLNEFFANGADHAVSVLKRLKGQFPGKDLWNVDYYGRLATRQRLPKGLTQAVLQDLVQVLSGQGVPPRDLSAWQRVYKQAGCRMVEVHDFEAPGLLWFIHRLRL